MPGDGPDPSKAIITGGAIGAGADILSSAANIAMGFSNRRWSERMANSAYQRQVADMKKAGLNPMLAIMKGGGADTPAAPRIEAGGSLGKLGQALSDRARFNAIERPLADAQSAKARAEEQLAVMSARVRESELPINEATAEKVRSAIALDLANTKVSLATAKNLEELKGRERFWSEIGEAGADIVKSIKAILRGEKLPGKGAGPFSFGNMPEVERAKRVVEGVKGAVRQAGDSAAGVVKGGVESAKKFREETIKRGQRAREWQEKQPKVRLPWMKEE